MKKSIGLIIVLCILVCSFAVSANEPSVSSISWSIENGVLTISGTGAMENYKFETETPWYDRKNEITSIVVNEGITHIGNLAFYGLKNAKEAKIASSVESVGVCAFSYTEGTRTSLGNLSAPFQFSVETSSSVVSKGDVFYITVLLDGDFKNVNAIQTAIIYDKEKVSIDNENWYDEEWYNSIDDSNLGYISKPMHGSVANNLRLAYLSMSGTKIDEGSPLYTKGNTELAVAKAKFTALTDIEDVNTSVFIIKNSVVNLYTDRNFPAEIGENQLTACTRLPIPGLKIITESPAAALYAKENSIACETNAKIPEKNEAEVEENKADEKTEEVVSDAQIKVVTNGEEIVFDEKPFINENGTLMVPLRAVMETKGVSVIWDNETQTVFMASDFDFAATQLGKKFLFKNETSVETDEASVAKSGRTLVSADFFQKSFGFESSWDDTTKTLSIK